jgi:hypothetical protein
VNGTVRRSLALRLGRWRRHGAGNRGNQASSVIAAGAVLLACGEVFPR